MVNKKKEHTLKNWQTHTIHYGFVEENGTILDEVMVSVMKAPRSYTTEDTVEINCHGGVLLTKRVLEAVLHAVRGWRSPGEFTKRAFLSGRIDLSEAEAVMDLIQAKNQFSMQASIKQLRGSVAEKVKNLRAALLYEIAFIESALDDPEHISTEGYSEKLGKITQKPFRRDRKADRVRRGRTFTQRRYSHCHCRKAECWKIFPVKPVGRRRACDCNGYRRHDAGCPGGIHPVKGNQFEYH